jgi:aryl-alcohol dehydrogenase-like predicted oxidoreductase
VRHALELGINIIDTAPGYGDSEIVLGEALSGIEREAFVLCTKFSSRARPESGALRRSLEASLRRLQTDYVDVMYFHGLSPSGYDDTIGMFMDELRQARDDGLTRFIGATEQYETDASHAALQRALEEDLFDVIMIGHNLMSPSGLVRVMPLAQAKDVGVVVMCAVRTIITTPDMLEETVRQWKNEGALPRDAVADQRPLDWVLGNGVESLADAAYKFAAESPAVSTVLTGTANVAHLEANLRAILGPPLRQEISERLREVFIPVSRSVLLHAFKRSG